MVDPDIRRIAGWQSSAFFCAFTLGLVLKLRLTGAFGYYYPKLFCHMRDTLRALYDREQGLVSIFSNSVYPAVAFNCGPQTTCKLHTDDGNAARMPCAVTAMGKWDSSKRGKVILWSIKRFIAIPHGATYWIPSATVPHGNTPIGKDESRGSLTQYCAGGLLRWVAYGFTSITKLLAQKGGAAKKSQYDGAPGHRAAEALAMYSKAGELGQDQRAMFGGT